MRCSRRASSQNRRCLACWPWQRSISKTGTTSYAGSTIERLICRCRPKMPRIHGKTMCRKLKPGSEHCCWIVQSGIRLKTPGTIMSHAWAEACADKESDRSRDSKYNEIPTYRLEADLGHLHAQLADKERPGRGLADDRRRTEEGPEDQHPTRSGGELGHRRECHVSQPPSVPRGKARRRGDVFSGESNAPTVATTVTQHPRVEEPQASGSPRSTSSSRRPSSATTATLPP